MLCTYSKVEFITLVITVINTRHKQHEVPRSTAAQILLFVWSRIFSCRLVPATRIYLSSSNHIIFRYFLKKFPAQTLTFKNFSCHSKKIFFCFPLLLQKQKIFNFLKINNTRSFIIDHCCQLLCNLTVHLLFI